MSDRFSDPTLQQLHHEALALPEVVETGACVKRSFKVTKKSFLFLGEKPGEINLMVKLSPSLPQAEALSSERPAGQVAVGKNRWVTVKLPPGDTLGAELLRGWVRESYQQQAPKRLTALLEG